MSKEIRHNAFITKRIQRKSVLVRARVNRMAIES